jgi:serine phosphatase RsbU (regulator of sigma subunit)
VDNRQFDDLGLQNAINNTPADSRRVDFVMACLRQHQQQQEQSDDISLLELNLPRIYKALEQ